MNKTLRQFYNDYAAWLDKGAPEGQPFHRHVGLCMSVTQAPYCLPPWKIKKQLEEAGLDTIYPFGGEYQFETDFDNATMHTNPLRIQWVKDHANNQ